MKKLNLLAMLMCVFVFTGHSQTKVNSKFGKGIYNVVAQDSSWSMKMGMRFQNLFIGETTLDGNNEFESNFLVRRSRLKFGGFAINPKLTYKVELGLTNRDISGWGAEHKNAPRMILDAVVKYNFAGNFVLWVGQTKLPGNRERVVSSGNLQFVDRSLLNKRYNIDRDMGIQLRHHFTIGNMIVREMVSFSQGEGRNITVGNLGGYDYTGRIEFLPFGNFKSKGDYSCSDLKRENTPKLAFGLTYDYHNNAVRERGQGGDFMYINNTTNQYFETDINTIFADMMFKYRGWSVMAEYAKKTASNGIALNDDKTPAGFMIYSGTGSNVQAGYLFRSNWELAARYTSINPDTGVDDNHHQYTLGCSRYIAGHKLKVQGDISLLQEETKDDGLMFRLQMDVHF